ncbi:MAG: membrane protein insertion efficiency factor YidD [Nitrospinota bacterium]
MTNPACRLALALIRAYQLVFSPLVPASCRFAPSCSEYARQAYRRYGFVRATRLAAARLLRCHPFHPGGLDPLR